MGYDVAIVGSGIAGQTAGIILARHGYSVIVLEQSLRTGGLMQTFRRGHCRFSPGVHCLGSLGPGQIFWRYFKYLGVLDRIRLVAMDPGNFLECRFGVRQGGGPPGLTFQMPYPAEEFRQRLLKTFPTEEAAVDQYLDDIRNTVTKFSLYNLTAKAERIPTEVQNRSLENYLKSLTSSRDLYAVLTAINPFYAVPPAQCPLYLHFLLTDSFLKSSWRVDETYYPLAKAFEDVFRQAGGEVRCNAHVTKIECVDGQVKGVRLDGGEVIEATRVIFTGHPKHIPDMCSDKALRPIFRQRLIEAEETTGVFGIAVGWEDSECPMARTDTIIYNSWNTAEQYSQRLLSEERPPHMLYFSAAPESTKGTYSVIALNVMLFDEFAPWQNTRTGARPASYNSAKDQLAERILSVAKEQWPAAGTKTEIKASFTPLTFRDYTLTVRGSAYGFKKSIDALHSARIGATTRVKGLFMAGQSVIIPGMLGSVISSVNVCCAILGRKTLINQIIRETE